MTIPMNTRSFQVEIANWLSFAFGTKSALDKPERNHRFLEEAVELFQACGGTEEDAHMLVNYVFCRPVGEVGQEAGGVMVTLAALCNVQGIILDDAALDEMKRIWQLIDLIRAKQASKPASSTGVSA